MAETSSRSKRVDQLTGPGKEALSQRPIKGYLIDTPLVATNLLAENFLFNFPQTTTLLPTPEQWPNLDTSEETLGQGRTGYCRLSGLDSSEEETLLYNSDLSELSPWTEVDLPSTTHSDRAVQILKNKIQKSRAGESVLLCHLEGKALYLPKANPKLADQSKEAKKKAKSRWIDLRKRTEENFALNMEDSKRFQLRFNEMMKCGAVAWLNRIYPEFNITKTFLKDTVFSVESEVKDDLSKSDKGLHGDAVWPDLCKFFAFMSLSRGDVQKCAYYLSESHGTFWKVETCDKHNLQSSRMEELSFFTNSKEVVKQQEILKQKIHALQSKALLEFGNSYSNFHKQMKKHFQPSWNVIQITTDAHFSNRFGKDFANLKQMPGIWITCFNTLQSGEVRSTTHYIPKHRRNVWEESFTKLINDNKAVSEGCIADRKLYWLTRSKHNCQLRDFLSTIEDWISPYAFLFPGNRKSTEMRNECWKHVDKIKTICTSPLNDAMSIILYKLIENFKYFPMDRINLSVFLRNSLAISSEIASEIIEYLTKLHQNAPTEGLQRHATILILDAELERYPLDWLPVFRKSATPVNRMFSMAHIYATSEVTWKFIRKYPEFVQPKRGTYVINPDKSLGNVQQRLEGYFGARDWNGVCGRNLTFQEFEDALQKRDVMVYCGHGSGGCMYPDWAISKLLCRSVPILMGCSSAQTKFIAPKGYHSTALHAYFSALCPSVVGFLWEITDIECDRVTIDLLERWLPCPEGRVLIPQIPNFDPNKERAKETGLSVAVLKSRFAATQFMTEASLVVYGLPLYTV